MPGFMDQTAGGSGFIPGAPTIAQAPSWQDQEAKIKRTLAMAEALRAQGIKQPEGQMVSGHYVAPSWAERLVPLFNQGQAGYMERQADRQQGALQFGQEQGAADWMRQMPQAQEITTEQPFQAPGIDEADAAAASAGAKVLKKSLQQPTMQERMLWAQEGQRNPLTKALAAAYGADTLIKEPERQAAREERVEARAEREARAVAERESRERVASQARELQAQIAAGNMTLREAQIKMQETVARIAQEGRAASQAGAAETRNLLEEDRKFRRANTLRDDYTKATDKAREAQFQAKQVLNAVPNLDQMNAQQQMASVFAFMRMLDPGSVVRESEYMMAERAKGLLDTVRNYGTQLQTGKRLTPQQVADMQAVAHEINAAMEKVVGEKQNYFREIAERNKLDPRDVIPGWTPPQQQGAPSGAVRVRGEPASPPAAAGSGPPPGAVRPR